jgi:hypothetical protein
VPSNVKVLNVLIASPGDANPARDAVEKALRDWNNHRGDAEKTFLRPQRWEMDSVPILGQGDAQSVINSQMVDKSHIIFALFYHRLGTATPRAISGTVEEIQRSLRAGKPVHVYFAQKKLPYEGDVKQFEALKAFRWELASKNLVGTFKSVDELRLQVSRALERDVSALRAKRGPSAAKQSDVAPKTDQSLEEDQAARDYPFLIRALPPEEHGILGNRISLRVENLGTSRIQINRIRIENITMDPGVGVLSGPGVLYGRGTGDYSKHFLSSMLPTRPLIVTISWTIGTGSELNRYFTVPFPYGKRAFPFL